LLGLARLYPFENTSDGKSSRYAEESSAHDPAMLLFSSGFLSLLQGFAPLLCVSGRDA
jgi:hypothetical protein